MYKIMAVNAGSSSLKFKLFEMPEEKVIVNIAKYGNTSAATIPMALSEKIGDGTIKKGDLVVLTAMGAGFTWASSVIRL